jgi:glycosyltransferase involved in cell wall biosynthesis
MQMEKGIPEIIESARYLIDEFPDLHFYFIGGPLNREKKYREMIRNEKLPQEKFLFQEKQPIKTVPLWLQASDILLMPYPKNDHFSYFMSPLKMFEYMASKRPIVGSRLPAIEEILTDGKTALLSEPGNPKDIAGNIRMLLLNLEMGKSLAENAFNVVKKYTWIKRAERILKCLD